MGSAGTAQNINVSDRRIELVDSRLTAGGLRHSRRATRLWGK